MELYFGRKIGAWDSVWNAIPIYVNIEDLWVDTTSKGKHIAWDGKSTHNFSIWKEGRIIKDSGKDWK